MDGKGVFSRWKTVSSNTLFGVFKSLFAYGFLVAYYKLSPGPVYIESYIDYELWAAASILFTFGIQARSYKVMDVDGLKVLSLFLYLILAFLFFLNSSYSWAWGHFVLAYLVVSDRLLDVQLQIERQQGFFNFYNVVDILNSIFVKASFVLFVLDNQLWVFVGVAKLLASGYLLFRNVRFSDIYSGCREIKGIACNFVSWMEWYFFDVLNFAAMNLDVVIVRFVGTGEMLVAYFYARKFIRLPLVLINYIVDPLYIKVRKIQDQTEAKKKVLEILVPVYWGSFFVFYAVAAWLFFYKTTPLVPVVGVALAVTAYFSVMIRFGDVLVLLFYQQRARILLRLLSLSGTFLLMLPFSNDSSWLLAFSCMPIVGWVLPAIVVFRSSVRRNYVHIFLSLGVCLSIALAHENFMILSLTSPQKILLFIVIVGLGSMAAKLGLRELKRVVL